MAILNGVDGKSHVEVADDNKSWSGYILVDPDPDNLRYFHVIPVSVSKVVYEGTVLYDGKYVFGHGDVYVRKVNFTPEEFRVDFTSREKFNHVKVLSSQPSDFLP